jgi:hypothetical protein
MEKKNYPRTKEQQHLYSAAVEGDEAMTVAAIIEYCGKVEAEAVKDAVIRLLENNETLHTRIIGDRQDPEQVFDVASDKLYEINVQIGERMKNDGFKKDYRERN